MRRSPTSSTTLRSADSPAAGTADINDLSAAQHGIVGTRQLREAGFSRSARQQLVTSQRFEQLAPGVLRALSAPATSSSRAMAAVIAAGTTAMLSHSSAAALWGLPGFLLEPLHVTVIRDHNPVSSRIATVHRQRSLARVASARIDGLPVVRPEILIIQLCGMVHPERAARLLDRAWSERLLSGRSLARVLASIDTRGLRGVRVVRELLKTRGPDYTPPASGLEARVCSILQDAGVPELARQVDLGDVEHWCGRVDFVDTDAGFVLEVDSEKYHTALVDREHDRARAARLERAGFVVGSVTDFQAWHRPKEVVATVRRLRRTALARHRDVPRSGCGSARWSVQNHTQNG